MRGERPAELVVGSVQLGLSYGAANRTGKPTRENAVRLIRRAADAGVTQFDTARAYGDAEDRLGEALGARPAVRTITKLSPLGELAAGATRETVRAAVDRSIHESMEALRVPRLDCLLLHRAEHMTAFDGAIWNRLIEHLEEGGVLALGVSVQSPAEALSAFAKPDIRHIQLPFNLLDWRWREEGVIDALAAHPSVTVHARSVFLQGLLAADDAAVWPPVSGVDAPRVVKWLRDSAAEHKRESVADLALAFARAQGWIDGVVVGMETIEQLEVNLSLATRPPLTSSQCAAIEAARPHVPAALLDPSQWPARERAQ